MKLVVTCDDFGESEDGNRRIAKAWKRGLIDRASLLVDGQATGSASELVVDSGLPVGLHFHLGIPNVTNSLELLQSLTTNVFGSLHFRKVSEELKRQMQLIKGLSPKHFDSHMHTHLFPWVVPIVEKSVTLPVRGARAVIGPPKAHLIAPFARQFPTFDYLVDLDWWSEFSPGLITSIFKKVPKEASVEMIVHPPKRKSLEWLLEHGSLHRYSRL